MVLLLVGIEYFKVCVDLSIQDKIRLIGNGLFMAALMVGVIGEYINLL